MTENSLQEHPIARRHDLLLDSQDITSFLNDFTTLIAGHLAGDGDEDGAP